MIDGCSLMQDVVICFVVLPLQQQPCHGRADNHRAQICWDGGLLVCCDECPASYHFDCLGMTEEVRMLQEKSDHYKDLCLPQTALLLCMCSQLCASHCCLRLMSYAGHAQALGVPAPQMRGVRALHSGGRRSIVSLPGLRERCRPTEDQYCCCALSCCVLQCIPLKHSVNRDIPCMPCYQCAVMHEAAILTSMVTSGTAYCEDHLPHDADILQICPRFQYLGQLHPRPVRGGLAALPVTTALQCLLEQCISPGACSWCTVAALRFANAQRSLTACGAQACFVHCCADCRAFTESMPHLFDEATLIEKQRAAEAARRAEEAAAREAADAAAAEAAAAEAEAEEAGRKVRCIAGLWQRVCAEGRHGSGPAAAFLLQLCLV